jgi:hypothetical protein
MIDESNYRFVKYHPPKNEKIILVKREFVNTLKSRSGTGLKELKLFQKEAK